MSHPSMQNIGAFIKGIACALFTATAAGTGDNTKVNGVTIDRLGFGSCQLAATYKTTLGSAETLTLAVEIQESDLGDGSDWTTADVIYAATTVETGVQTAKVGEKLTDIDLSERKRYVRFNITPNLSAAGTDTVVGGLVCTLGGAASVPAHS